MLSTSSLPPVIVALTVNHEAAFISKLVNVEAETSPPPLTDALSVQVASSRCMKQSRAEEEFCWEAVTAYKAR